MAKVKKPVRQSKQNKVEQAGFQFPLGRSNLYILGLGVLVLIIGYICMAIPNDPNDFLTRTLAPVLLVFSFLVIFPLGLLYKGKDTD